MTIYLLKTVLCSAILLLAYYLLLEKENMYRFNRFYLIGSLIFSCCIPLLTFETAHKTAVPLPEVIQRSGLLISEAGKTGHSEEVATFDAYSLLRVIYGLISFALLARFIRSLSRILTTIKNKAITPYQNAKIVLINDKLIPHSFMNYIFVNKETYETGQVEPEILLHELTHVRQKHSLDVLFIEFLRAIMWFNPVLWLYKRAIQLNHEFLADEAVIKTDTNTSAYQFLLIAKASESSGLKLSSQFNFLMTKKRLIMMNKITNPMKAFWKQVALIPLIGLSVYVFSTRVVAQEAPKVSKSPQAVHAGEGVSEEVMKEYAAIVEKYTIIKGNTIKYDIPESEQPKMEKMYFSMSKEQQAKQKLYFGKLNTPLPKEVPTPAQIEAWKNPKTYGVWIDGKKVSNDKLNHFKNTDFSQVFVSRLYGKAKENVSYKFQVDLMTTPHYNTYVKNTVTNDKYYMLVRFGKI